jgi:hypothetical protein
MAYLPESDTLFAINIPLGSNDVNFLIVSPDWYQYTALGFGSRMDGALMLIAYPASDGQRTFPRSFLL